MHTSPILLYILRSSSKSGPAPDPLTYNKHFAAYDPDIPHVPVSSTCHPYADHSPGSDYYPDHRLPAPYNKPVHHPWSFRGSYPAPLPYSLSFLHPDNALMPFPSFYRPFPKLSSDRFPQTLNHNWKQNIHMPPDFPNNTDITIPWVFEALYPAYRLPLPATWLFLQNFSADIHNIPCHHHSCRYHHHWFRFPSDRKAPLQHSQMPEAGNSQLPAY